MQLEMTAEGTTKPLPFFYFKLFGLEVSIQKLEYSYPEYFATISHGPGDRWFLLFGNWRVICNW